VVRNSYYSLLCFLLVLCWWKLVASEAMRLCCQYFVFPLLWSEGTSTRQLRVFPYRDDMRGIPHYDNVRGIPHWENVNNRVESWCFSTLWQCERDSALWQCEAEHGNQKKS
jgi:hypothetical protein